MYGIKLQGGHASWQASITCLHTAILNIFRYSILSLQASRTSISSTNDSFPSPSRYVSSLVCPHHDQVFCSGRRRDWLNDAGPSTAPINRPWGLERTRRILYWYSLFLPQEAEENMHKLTLAYTAVTRTPCSRLHHSPSYQCPSRCMIPCGLLRALPN